MAAQAKGMSGRTLEQLVTRIQRHTGRRRESCWRLIIQYGIKGRLDYRRWTEAEFDQVREELVKASVEEVAKKIKRTPQSHPQYAAEESPKPARDPLRSVLSREPGRRPPCPKE